LVFKATYLKKKIFSRTFYSILVRQADYKLNKLITMFES